MKAVQINIFFSFIVITFIWGKIKKKFNLFNEQNLEEEVVIHRRKIDTMEESGEWIIKTSNNNQEVISDIRSNITRAKSTIDEVTVKLNDRRRRLETALSENQKLQITFDDFSSRVGKVDKSLARAKPVSAMYIEIREQKITHEVRFF